VARVSATSSIHPASSANSIFATLTSIIDSYEAEENRVCAKVPQCSTDRGVRAGWIDHVNYFSADANHLNTIGLAAEADRGIVKTCGSDFVVDHATAS
jgi:hypothetical protein